MKFLDSLLIDSDPLSLLKLFALRALAVSRNSNSVIQKLDQALVTLLKELSDKTEEEINDIINSQPVEWWMKMLEKNSKHIDQQ